VQVLPLEEAHRYIPAAADTRARATFERLAKEGRKFGLGVLPASQRPAELAPTVLAQCGTLIAHRAVNSADQQLIRDATPFASREVLHQLPGLATQHAVVLGESVPAPAYVRVQDVQHAPMGRDPDFLGRWREPPKGDLVEEIAREWERATPEVPSVSGEDSPRA
jgi:hypothetical protein